MKINIKEDKENKLLNRREVVFDVEYDGEATPNRLSVQAKLAALLNDDAEKTVIRKIQGHYGVQRSTGYAYIYPDIETRDRIETKQIVKRNSPKEAEA